MFELDFHGYLVSLSFLKKYNPLSYQKNLKNTIAGKDESLYKIAM